MMTTQHDGALGFVVWLDANSSPTEPRGSVEHVSSATRVRFASASDLVRFFSFYLERPEEKRLEDEGRSSLPTQSPEKTES